MENKHRQDSPSFDSSDARWEKSSISCDTEKQLSHKQGDILTQRLENEGVEKFCKPFDKLIETLTKTIIEQ